MIAGDRARRRLPQETWRRACLSKKPPQESGAIGLLKEVMRRAMLTASLTGSICRCRRNESPAARPCRYSRWSITLAERRGRSDNGPAFGDLATPNQGVVNSCRAVLRDQRRFSASERMRSWRASWYSSLSGLIPFSRQYSSSAMVKVERSFGSGISLKGIGLNAPSSG